MSTPVKVEHPSWMSEDDIATYDNLVSIGRLQLGKEISVNEGYLIDISAMITLKQMKGMLVDIDDESIVKLKLAHKEFAEKGLNFTTPESSWYESARVLKEPYLDDVVQTQIDMANGLTSNLIVKSCEDKKTSNIADESNDVIDDTIVVDDIKTGWVKPVIARLDEAPL
jgi:hypothetical protein